jgi:hypothetical protein
VSAGTIRWGFSRSKKKQVGSDARSEQSAIFGYIIKQDFVQGSQVLGSSASG